MSCWDRNLAILEKVNPAVAKMLAQTLIPADHVLQASRQGSPYLQVGRQKLHSSYDPVKEGAEWAKAQELESGKPPVIFGLGLGYHLFPLMASGISFLVVEPSPAVARLALEVHDFTELLARDALRLGRQFHDLPMGSELLAYPPSRRLFPQLYRRLAAFLAGESKNPGPLRVLVVSPLYGGSYPIARYATRAFRQLGHDAELLDLAPFHPGYQVLNQITNNRKAASRLHQDLERLLGEVVLTRVRDFAPDLVFFLAQSPVNPEVLRIIKKEGPLLAYWFVEDFQVFPYWQDLAPEVDVFFVLQKEPFFQELKGHGVQNYAFLPLAADPEVYRPLTLTREEQRQYGSALSFVGAGYRNRQEFFQGLLDFDFKIWGSDWRLTSPLGPFIQKQGARVSEEEIVRIFNASLINLNLHSSPFHAGINPQGDYLNPRVFDLAAAGAFQLVDWRSQLPEFFQPELEVVTFTSLTEVREKIGYFLAHAEERCQLALKSRERCRRDHTYTQRLDEALEIIQDLHPGVLPQRPRPESPWQSLRRLFPPDHPVQVLLARPGLEQVSDLGDLVERLKEDDAPLTEPEAIFWLLHEFQQGLKRGRF